MPSSIKTLARQRDQALARATRAVMESDRLRALIQQAYSALSDAFEQAWFDYTDEEFGYYAIPEIQANVLRQMRELLAKEERCVARGRPKYANETAFVDGVCPECAIEDEIRRQEEAGDSEDEEHDHHAH